MKNAIIGGVVGMLFMGGGFFYGMKLKPLPVPPAPVVAAPVASAVSDKPKVIMPALGSPVTFATLQKTSESMMSVNEALQAREKAVAEREAKVQHREDEIAAERASLDRSHAQFKDLYNEFKQRLILVEANQVTQLQKQSDLYDAMGTTQSIDLMRALDDSTMIRIFSIMDTKPLGKLIAEWKTKHPEDTPRLIHNLNGMANVMPQERIALSTDATDTPSPGTAGPGASDASAPDPGSPLPVAAPAATPDSSSASAPAATPDGSAAPASGADATPAPPLAPPADSPSTPTPATTANSN